jgi:3-oxoadipate enol-lactonase
VSPLPDPLVVGSGDPVTVVAHGLGATLEETRALTGGVPGTRVLPVARGHGAVAVGDGTAYEDLGADLRAVADGWGATRAVGVSLGAGALTALLAAAPARLERAVLLLPAVLDRPRDPSRALALADALESGSAEVVRAWVAAELGDVVATPAGDAYAEARAAYLLASPGLPALVRTLAAAVPVADRSALGTVSTEVLVVGQEGDDVHPASVAREVAAALPRARLVVVDRPGLAWHSRRELRALLSEFLGDEGRG